MSDIKEVKVAMSEADMKAFSRGTTRRRRTKSSINESPVSTDPLMGGSSVAVEKNVEVAPLPTPAAPVAPLPTPAAPVVSTAAPVHVAPQPALPSTAAVGGAVTPIVNIQAKKLPVGQPVSASVGAGPRIIPTKKRVLTPAHTLKKPRLVVNTGALPAPDPIKAPLAQKQAPSNETAPSTQGVSGVPKKKRRFTERKISIEVKSASATRKHHRTLKDKIESMSSASVKKFLLRKGVLKPKADGKMPPEDMMRSMLKDYLLLHAAE